MLMDYKMLLGAQRYFLAALFLLGVWSILRYSSFELEIPGRVTGTSSTTAMINGTSMVDNTSEANASGMTNTTPEPESASLRDAIKAVFSSIKIDPTQRYYKDVKGKYFHGAYGNASTWKEPLGKKVLLLDMDTRVPTGDNQILNQDKKLDWETLESMGTGLVSHAIADHYMYAMIHGYDYRYYQAAPVPDHYPTWIKPHILKEVLPDYQFVVAMDADVVVAHPEVPLEWMFNRWGIAKHTSMALPNDTEEFRAGKSISTDSKGVLVLNSGFIVAQNNDLTFEMLEAWGNCTTEKRYPGCAQWKGEWSHEQRAFSEYIRYDFDRTPDTIVTIACDDAMGYPGFKAANEAAGNIGIADCSGNFIRHYTTGKLKVHTGGAQTIVQALTEVLQKSLLENIDKVWQKETTPLVEVKNEEDEVQNEEEKEADVGEQDQNKEAEKADDEAKSEGQNIEPNETTGQPAKGETTEVTKQKEQEDTDAPTIVGLSK